MLSYFVYQSSQYRPSVFPYPLHLNPFPLDVSFYVLCVVLAALYIPYSSCYLFWRSLWRTESCGVFRSSGYMGVCCPPLPCVSYVSRVVGQ